MALSLLMASCAPVVTEEDTVTEEEVTPPKEPKYGGEIRQSGAIGGTFDPGYGSKGGPGLNCENLLTGDWTKGPAGTSEVTWVQSPFLVKNEVG